MLKSIKTLIAIQIEAQFRSLALYLEQSP